MSFAIRALDESTWPAFAALVERNNGVFGGCWCMGFHGDDSRNDAGLNRERKLAWVRAGTTHGALVFRTGGSRATSSARGTAGVASRAPGWPARSS